jgi:hypothetical protein
MEKIPLLGSLKSQNSPGRRPKCSMAKTLRQAFLFVKWGKIEFGEPVEAGNFPLVARAPKRAET